MTEQSQISPRQSILPPITDPTVHAEIDRLARRYLAAGGIAMEFPTHPIQETAKRPTAMLDRNLAYLSLVEVLYGYPLDGVVLTGGCDKTTPAVLMGAATVNIPAILLPHRYAIDGPRLMLLASVGAALVILEEFLQWRRDQNERAIGS